MKHISLIRYEDIRSLDNGFSINTLVCLFVRAFTKKDKFYAGGMAIIKIILSNKGECLKTFFDDDI